MKVTWAVGTWTKKDRLKETALVSEVQCIISSKHSAKNLIFLKKSGEDYVEKITYIFSKISNLEDF